MRHISHKESRHFLARLPSITSFEADLWRVGCAPGYTFGPEFTVKLTPLSGVDHPLLALASHQGAIAISEIAMDCHIREADAAGQVGGCAELGFT